MSTIGRTLTRLLPRLTPEAARQLTYTERAYLRQQIARTISTAKITPSDPFPIAPFPNPRQFPGFDYSFVIVALLTLAEASDTEAQSLAESLSRGHPYERVREAADEYLRAVRRTLP